jgi:hypothetical protein
MATREMRRALSWAIQISRTISVCRFKCDLDSPRLQLQEADKVYKVWAYFAFLQNLFYIAVCAFRLRSQLLVDPTLPSSPLNTLVLCLVIFGSTTCIWPYYIILTNDEEIAIWAVNFLLPIQSRVDGKKIFFTLIFHTFS